MKQHTLLAVLVAAGLFSCRQPALDTGRDPFVDSLLHLMTLEEKVGQLTLFTSDYNVTGPTMRDTYKEDIRAGRVGAIFNAVGPAYIRTLQELAVKETRLGIPLLFGYDVIHGHRTIFPIPLGEAASWDLSLIEKNAYIAAAEAAADGLNWTFAPMCDIARDPRWGRISEGAGEDPWLGSRVAEARVRGFQGDETWPTDRVLACVKHFAAYGAPNAGRDYHSVDMSERKLREIYLLPYEAAVKAGARTVMTSFNDVNGIPATASHWLMTEVLRNEWGFKGFVVTDYTSIMELIPHGVAADTLEAAKISLDAGVDMDMQAAFYQVALPELLEEKKISEEQINEAVRRILLIKKELGLFRDPYKYCDTVRQKETIMKPEFLEASRDAARKSIVLLKNENNLLPLPAAGKTLAVIGPLGKDQRNLIGNWSAAGDWKKAVSVFDGITAALGSEPLYAKGANISDDSAMVKKLNQHGGDITLDDPQTLLMEAMRIAARADVILAVCGESQGMSGEAASRSDITLPQSQKKLLEALERTGKPIVLILMNGRPLALEWEDGHLDAIVETWFAGTAAGYGIADVLFGAYNPSAKLPVTFPRNAGQIPVYYAQTNTGRPFDENNKYTSKYLDVPNTPLYPFGYGLSYTEFTYSDVVLGRNRIGMADSLLINVTVTNAGSRDGEEVVQLYLKDEVASVTRPVRELKRFSKVSLPPGGSKTVSFVLYPGDLRFLDQEMAWIAEAGTFTVFVGGNSDAMLSASFELVKE